MMADTTHRTWAAKGVQSLRDAFREFQANDPLRMAAATSFFASFALPPILIILIELMGLAGIPRDIRRGLLEQLGTTVDRNIALQVREILRNVRHLAATPGIRIGGFIFLLFVATTLFEVIRSSLNQLWGVRLRGRVGVGFVLTHRVASVGIIMMAGLLFSLVFFLDAVVSLLPALGGKILYHLITIAASMSWFTLILRYHSYARPAWRTAIMGGVFTGLLFTLGTVILHVVLSYNNMKTIYGASTSIVLLLLFVFYCSFIFYFGACFTDAVARQTDRPMRLIKNAVRYTITVADKNVG